MPWLAVAAAAWLVSVLAGLLWRAPLPIDETRYLSVAWTMWRDGTLLVPHLNGAPYSHKPPLLFWLIHAGWAIGGVNALWARLVAPLAALAALPLTARIARRLWPDDRQAPVTAALLLTASGFWLAWSSLTMFDMLVVTSVLAGVLGLLDAAERRRRRGWAIVAVAGGLGILAKGPVALLPIAVLVVLAPLWTRPPAGGWRGWAGGGLLALAGAAAIGLAWALPAAELGGEAYAQRLLWGQTAGRIAESFAHARPAWWYLLILPLLLLPAVLLMPAWRGHVRAWRSGDRGVRLCTVWALGVFVIMSAISGKQAHYMLPILPALALTGARALAQHGPVSRRARLPVALFWVAVAVAGVAVPIVAIWVAKAQPYVWAAPATALVAAAIAAATLAPVRCTAPGAAALTATGTAVFVVTLNIAFATSVGPRYDLRPLAEQVAAWQRAGTDVAILRAYDGQLSFLGRLPRPINVVERGGIADWAAEHPDGHVIEMAGHPPSGDAGGPGAPSVVQPYRDDVMLVWPARRWVAAQD